MKIYLIALFVLIFTSTQAQQKQNLIKLSIGVINKVRLGYEYPLNEKFSVGGVVDYYYGEFPGIKLEPFARYYFGRECPTGLYSQARFLYGHFKSELKNPINSYSNGQIFNSIGGGLDLGYQWLSGKNKNIIVDISLGAQFMPSKISSTSQRSGAEIDAGFFILGPGAIFNPHLSIGFAF